MRDALKKFSLVAASVLGSLISAAAQAQQEVEMADVLRRDGKIYTVVVGLLIVVTGFVVFLLRVDKRVRRLNDKK